MTRFMKAAKETNYVDVPDNWIVIITDIANSTIAISEGRYKDVNSLGAAVIAAIRNAMEKIKFPFIFGGDGAILLIQPEYETVTVEALKKMKYFANISYELDLRIGYGTISKLRSEGFEFKTAHYLLSKSYDQILFRGSGFEEIERRLKYDETSTSFNIIRDVIEEIPDLTGFECKWHRVKSPKGYTLALLVKVMERGKEEMEIYDLILSEIFSIYGTEMNINPISDTNHKQEIVLPKHNATKRRKGSSRNADYLKMDDMIRMIIASSEEEKDKLIEMLEKYSAIGVLCYGLHISDSAVLTCVVDINEEDHFQLIDAGDGGYAEASIELKKKMFSCEIR